MFCLGFICAFGLATVWLIAWFAWDEWREGRSLASRVKWLEDSVVDLQREVWK